LNKAGRAGKFNALRVVSRGIVDDLFAARVPRHTRFRWRQSIQNTERRQVVDRFTSIAGNPKIAQEISMHFTNPQTKGYILAFGNLTRVSREQRKQLVPVLRRICLAEFEGNHDLVIDLFHRVFDVNAHKLK